jgi:gamma-glutamylcyclotransferase (GGCT)/AIG2-like uncharacterized protein YtfP
VTNDTTYLFVYGTLRKGIASPVSKAIAEDMEWVGFSKVKGELYDIGTYPGAIPADSENFITGEILKINEPAKVLPVLDGYEGFDPGNGQASEYLRKMEWFDLNDGTRLRAWIYWYNFPVTGKRRITNNDYLQYLQTKQSA